MIKSVESQGQGDVFDFLRLDEELPAQDGTQTPSSRVEIEMKPFHTLHSYSNSDSSKTGSSETP